MAAPASDPWEDDRRRIQNTFDGVTEFCESARHTVRSVIGALNSGELRAAERVSGEWKTNTWVKQTILLYFRMQQMKVMEVGPFEFHDKIPLKKHLQEGGVRVVPPGTVRYGAYLEPGTIVMPAYVNIGAWVGSGTMVDTWATVGSCAQIGRNVHLAGGVGIGGVLEPPQAQPVIVEDNCFIGSRCIVTEGAIIEEGAVLGAGVIISGSIPIIDCRPGLEGALYYGRVPTRAVVVGGTREREYGNGLVAHLNCAYIVGERNEGTDKKVTLEAALREHNIVG